MSEEGGQGRHVALEPESYFMSPHLCQSMRIRESATCCADLLNGQTIGRQHFFHAPIRALRVVWSHPRRPLSPQPPSPLPSLPCLLSRPFVHSY